jgi:hypothetical protein
MGAPAPLAVQEDVGMRWFVGVAAFLAPVVLVLTAASQTPVSAAARDIVGKGVGDVRGHVLKTVTFL